MAVTKIWPIKDSLRRVVDYARNPAKTEYTDLQAVLHYAANGEKTEHGAEKTMYVTGINCSRDCAFREMYAVQERFGKTGGNVAYHAYQSFKPGEVTPELCHQMGVELAKRMWGEDHQVLVATHFNTGTYHNHLVINSVNMWDGRKFDCSKRAYYELRRLSDELCEEHGLSVIRAPGGRTPRSIYFAEKNGEPTRYNLMRQAIDEAAAIARTPQDFDAIMRTKGYTVSLDPKRKYFTICSLGSKKPVRMERLGEGYDNKSILNRIYLDESPARFRGNREFWQEQHERLKSKPEKVRLGGSVHRVKKVTGLRALYLHYCYLLGYLPRDKPHKPLSPEMREAVRRMDRYSAQAKLAAAHKLDSIPAVEDFITQTENAMQTLIAQRNRLYNRMRRCRSPEELEELKAARDQCTRQLSALRREKNTAQGIIDSQQEIQKNIRAEAAMKHELYRPERTRDQKRGYVR